MYESLRQQELADELFSATAKRMQELYGDSVEVKRNGTLKNNGVVLDGVLFLRTGNQIAPTIYLEPYAEKIIEGKMSFDEAVEGICGLYVEQRESHIEMPVLDEEHAKERLYCTVINKGRNKELLRTVPHCDIPDTDLTLVLRYHVKCETDCRASFLIRNDMLGMFQMSENEAFEIAIANTKQNETYVVESMREMMLEMSMTEEILPVDIEPKMFVVTNQSKIYGATNVFVDKTLRAELNEKIGGEFLIIPSSIHETLCIPAKDADVEEIERMIKEINDADLAPEEILADHAFYCNEKQQLSIASMDLLQEEHDVVATKISSGAHI